MRDHNTSLQTRKTVIPSIILAWLIAGTMDICAAMIYVKTKGGSIPGLFKYIASAVYGKERAYGGGTEMIVTGLALHYAVALLLTVFFFLIYPHVRFLRVNPILTAIVYGSFAWVLMNLIIVPMTNTQKYPMKFQSAAINLVILMICIGMPLSLVARKHYLYNK